MICKSCGKEIQDSATFCPHCGETTCVSTPSSYAKLEAPTSATVGGKVWLVGGALVLIVAVAVVAVLMSGIFSSPKGRLEKAVMNTVAAYSAAIDQVGLPNLLQLVERRSIHQEFSLELNRVNSALAGYDLSALNGLGLQMNTGLSGAEGKLEIALDAFWSEDELISLQILAEDDALYFSSPQFTRGTTYGINTEAFIKELKQTAKDANKELWAAAQVEKAGKKTIDVNGTTVNAEVFTVVIPEKALNRYADTMMDVLSFIDYLGLYREMLEAFGMPQSEIDKFMSQFRDQNPYAALDETLNQYVELLGDVRLTAYVSKGRLSAVCYEERPQDSTVKMELYLGGGVEYVDDLGLKLEIDGETVTLRSTGNHGSTKGPFTDKTTLRMGMVQMTSELSYDAQQTGDNFSWELAIPGAGSLDMRGQLVVNKDSMALTQNNLSVRVMGMEVCSLGMQYYIGPYEDQGITVNNPKMIEQMDGLELVRAYVEIGANIQTWERDMQKLFEARLPQTLYQSMF